VSGPEAIIAAIAEAINAETGYVYSPGDRLLADMAEEAYKAAEPYIAAAERARLANRSQMVDEVKHELDDAFQFTEPDGSRYSHVSRAWVEVLLAISAASAGAAEQERCARLAGQHWCDCGAALAALLREQPVMPEGST
jgi:hypothetical protein